jgi:hypothetical protein
MRVYHVDQTRLERFRGTHTIESLGSSRCRKCWGPRGCKQSTIEEIAKILHINWWELLVDRERDEFTNRLHPDSTSTPPLYLFHREDSIPKKFFLKALQSKGEVLFLSVMSQHSFLVLDEHLAKETQLNVLTWMPDTAAEIIGYSKHLNERKTGNQRDDKIEQTRNALVEWDKRIDPSSELYRKNIQVWAYDSSPTMQGILVKGGWALLELLTYDTKPLFRPALLLRNDEETEHQAFNFFWDRCEALWAVSKKRKIGEMPDWTHENSFSRTAGQAT